MLPQNSIDHTHGYISECDLLGSGTISNRDASRGVSCIAERRVIEQLETGRASTPFLRFGERVRIEMQDRDGRSPFGAIEQQVVRYTPP